MLDRAFFGLFAFAVFIIMNDILGWGIIPNNGLTNISEIVLSPAYGIIEIQTGVDINPIKCIYENYKNYSHSIICLTSNTFY